MSSPRIRPAEPGDVREIRQVAERSWRRTYRGILPAEEIGELLGSWYSEEALRSSVRSRASTFLVAEAEEGCIGFGEWGERGHGPEIFRLYVDPRHWRGGAGSRLLEALESEMRERGADAACLFVHRENEIGRSFWEKHGFERFPEGDRTDDPCELCMKKTLERRPDGAAAGMGTAGDPG